ncbi:MAG TPA: hypothetical protein VLM85_03975 [Polyangiaceae bacterium]|nr:hypothetical protein [Polyangiaceae bacterium]
MILAIVTYNLPRRATLEEARSVASARAPTYLNVPGLLRKNFCLSEDGKRAGGVYVWDSKARAEAFYTPEWRQLVTGLYGAAPEIVYMHSPVMVDNSTGRIVTDEIGTTSSSSAAAPPAR